MKGVDTAIADPIDPINEYDERESVKDLIIEHKEKIDKIRADIEKHPLYDSSKHDDLWFLRFWLSHKKSKTAIAAAQHTLEFRKKYHLDDKDVRAVPPQLPPPDVEVLKRLAECHTNAMQFLVPDPQRGVIVFAKLAAVDQKKSVATLTQADVVDVYVYWSEWSHQNVDYVTRTTGRLTKSVRFVDLAHMPMFDVNMEYNKRESMAVHEMEDCYPQMLEKVYLVNCPVWVQIPWRILRPLMPKRVVSKIDFIDPAKRETERRRLYKYLGEDSIPTALGGTNTGPYVGGEA
jgi:hypothetical protein